MPSSTLPNVSVLFVLAASASAVFGCSDGDATSSSSASSASSSSGGTDGGGSTSSSASSASSSSSGGSDASSDAAPSGAGGIQLVAGGTSYALTDNASAAQAGNGWLIGANKIDGTKMRNLAIILNKAQAGANGAEYVPLTPGTYPCTTPGAPPFTWARLQYGTPDGSIYQSPSSAACTVTLTEFGAVGGAVKGTFSASLDRAAGTEPTPVAVSGSFDVVRKN